MYISKKMQRNYARLTKLRIDRKKMIERLQRKRAFAHAKNNLKSQILILWAGLMGVI